jgi:transglutaminase-like putative cysteine protease
MTRLADRAVVTVAVLAAGASFLGAFPPAPLLLTVGAATLVPAAAGLLDGLAGRWFLAAGSVGAVFVLLRGSVLDLLGMTFPAPATPGLLAAPAGLCWLAVVLGSEIVRLARRMPSLAALLPTLPILVLSGLLAPYGGFSRWPALLVVACVAVQLSRQFTGAAAWQTAASLTAVALVAAVAVPWFASRPVKRKIDPRSLVPAIALPPATDDPIDWVDVWLTRPGETLFRTSTSAPVRYWRWAVLTAYDGVQWRPPDRYARAGLGVPPARPTSGAVRQTVTIDQLPGPFLPAADRPVRVAGPVGGVDVDTATLLARGTVGTGFAYEVSSLPAARPADVHCGAPGGPDVPAELSAPLRTLIGEGCTGSFQAFARDVQRRLDAGRTNVAGAPAAGTSVGALRDFLAGRHSGTVVEFGSVFALALRAAGIPSRLVVGFETGGAGRVTGRDLRLWVEARLPGHGWIDFHPAFPQPRAASEPPLPSSRPRPSPTSPPPPSSSQSSSTIVDPPLGTDRRLLRLALAGTAGAAIGYVLLVLLVPVLRRRVRQRRGKARERAAAAWHDVLDELTFTVPAARLRAATPAATRKLVRAAPADAATMTRAAEQALFAADPPSETTVREAWRAAGRIRRRMRRRTDLRTRIGRALSWRNLRLRSPWW